MNRANAACFLLLTCGGSLSIPTSVLAQSFQIEEATLADVQEAFAGGELTSEMLVGAYLDRISAYDELGPRLNAILALNAAALETARALDQERMASGPVDRCTASRSS